jgi:tRNA U34 5-carboxymethylaminomethyl modifying GTPase MnmE/TrmE
LLKKSRERLVKNNKNEPIFSRERHIIAMKNALSILKSVNFNENLDIIAFKYREALSYSLEINQKFDIESVLDIIFKDFCIGK